MHRNLKLFDYILVIIASMSFIYFIILVIDSRFINGYLVYPIVSLTCGSFGIYELYFHQNILAKLPKLLSKLIKIMIICFTVLFIGIESCIIFYASNSYQSPSDYVIVLGARLNGNNPSLLLKKRLDEAINYHQLYPNIPIIVSGGCGNGENTSEAYAMKQYLINHDIDASLIIEEDKSTNTNENIQYSKDIIESLTDKQYQVTIITNGFHCFRSMILANKHDIIAHSYSAKENTTTVMHYYLREFFGCIKDIILS